MRMNRGVRPIPQMVLPSRVALRDSGRQYHGVIIRGRLRQGYHAVIARGKAKPTYHGVIARARNSPTYHGVIIRELGRPGYHAVIAPRLGKRCRRHTMKYLGNGRSTPDARWLRLSWPRGSRASSRSARLRRCPGTTVIRLPTLCCGRWTRRSGRSLSTGFLPREPTRFDEWPGGGEGRGAGVLTPVLGPPPPRPTAMARSRWSAAGLACSGGPGEELFGPAGGWLPMRQNSGCPGCSFMTIGRRDWLVCAGGSSRAGKPLEPGQRRFRVAQVVGEWPQRLDVSD